MRPKRLSDMVGAEKIVAQIRGHAKEKRMPPAWMFIGETGAGKTTIARILALSLQCTHQKLFGDPCKECRREKEKFDIYEVNGAKFTGKAELESILSSSDFDPRPGSQCRVYILDELQRASDGAQSLLLKYFEDSPKSTVWIICTTDPHKILETLQSRCLTYTVPSLKLEGLRTLVKKALNYVGSERDSSILVDALYELQVTSPRKVVNAVEKYVAGMDPEEAARMDLSTELDTYHICRALVKGDWIKVAEQIKHANPADGRAIRIAVCSYLRTIILEDHEIGSNRLAVVANCIFDLGSLTGLEDTTLLAAVTATLYRACTKFAGHPR